jgi:hypothetical protein
MELKANLAASPFSHLAELLEAALPGIVAQVDPPADTKNGAWHLDLTYEGRRDAVLYLNERGFGIWDFEPFFTENPSHFFPVTEAAAVRDRLIDKLAKRSRMH